MTRSRRVSSGADAPVGVAVLWRPHAVSRHELWGAVDQGLGDLAFATGAPVADEMGEPAREVAVVHVPWARDEARLGAELVALWESAGLLSLYTVAPDPTGVEAAHALLRRLFDAFPLARLGVGRPALSADDVLPYHPFCRLTHDEAVRLVRPHLGAVLTHGGAEEWMLPTLRALLGAVSWTFDGLAAHLGISVNGLRKRLGKLSALTGSDLTRAQAYVAVPFELRLALHVYDLFAHELPTPGEERWD